jgi:hypothetical protein
VSQDRASNSAGPSVDYIVGDEAKHLNFEKLQELFQTNRGNRQYYGKLSVHHSLLFCTDMPTSPKSQWILDYENQMDGQVVEEVKAVQREVIRMTEELASATKTRAKRLKTKIRLYEAYLNEKRKGLVYFSEFSTLENLEVVGEQYIKDQKLSLSPMKYKASILNIRVKKEEGMFYPMLDEDLHYYYNFKYQKIDALGYDFSKIMKHDYEQDGDIDPRVGLDIGLDYNAVINSVTVGQYASAVNFLFVKSPLMLKDAVELFCKYYKKHPTREVNYYYDHTAIGRNAMTGDYTFSDQVIDILTAHGWNVNAIYIGQAPTYEARFEMFNNALRGCKELPMPKFNRHNCEKLLTSMENTMTRQGRTGFEIDKRSEKDPNILPEHATHPQESWSTWFWGKFGSMWNATEDFDDAMMM